ncbi:DUF1206 domain-containing protein [Terribacillus saccharophilus]|uniref:DUF1206 domain-containing protein n=1 Tax=Terribacillus saccharophilus TaxID=361277 RepID=UPI003982C4EB
MAGRQEAKQKARETKEETKPWIRRFGRIGYMSQGIVYALIGILALFAAFQAGGKTTDTGGMLQELAGMPFGNMLLWLIGIGLVGYVCWDAILAIKDPNREGNGVKGIIIRIGYGISTVIYASIAFNAIRFAATNHGSGGNSEQSLSAKLLSYPFGEWLMGAVGLIIIGYGIYEFFSGMTGTFLVRFKTAEMNKHEKRVALHAGRVGLISRGIVFGMVGFFFVLTAFHSNPDEAKGLDGALAEVSQQPFGRWLLGIVSIGFILFGIYSIIRGRYEKMSFGKNT